MSITNVIDTAAALDTEIKEKTEELKRLKKELLKYTEKEDLTISSRGLILKGMTNEVKITNRFTCSIPPDPDIADDIQHMLSIDRELPVDKAAITVKLPLGFKDEIIRALSEIEAGPHAEITYEYKVQKKKLSEYKGAYRDRLDAIVNVKPISVFEFSQGN